MSQYSRLSSINKSRTSFLIVFLKSWSGKSPRYMTVVCARVWRVSGNDDHCTNSNPIWTEANENWLWLAGRATRWLLLIQFNVIYSLSSLPSYSSVSWWVLRMITCLRRNMSSEHVLKTRPQNRSSGIPEISKCVLKFFVEFFIFFGTDFVCVS